MPKFSNQLLQGLINPTYGDSLNKAGMLLGAAPGRAKAVATQKDNLTQVMGSISTAMQAAQNGNIAAAQQAQAAASALLPTLSPQNQQLAGQQLNQLNSTLAAALPVKRAADKEAASLAQLEAQKQAGLKVATTRGDQSAIEALNSGSIAGTDYLKGIYEGEQKIQAVKPGESYVRGLGTEGQTTLVKGSQQPLSKWAKVGVDLGKAAGSPENKAFVNSMIQFEESKPQSELAKQIVAAGHPVGSPDFIRLLNESLERDTPVVWEQLKSVAARIEGSPLFKAAEDDHINAGKALTMLDQAKKGNVKSLAPLITAMATLVNSSSRAQAEIDNIRKGNSLAGSVLDKISTGLAGSLTASSLKEYESIIRKVIMAAGSGKGEVVNKNLEAAKSLGLSEAAIQAARDMYSVKAPLDFAAREAVEVGGTFAGHKYLGGDKDFNSSWEPI